MALFLLMLVAVPFGLSAVLSRWLRRSGDARILRSLDGVPATARIVVLGCAPETPSGRPNRYFIGRIASSAAAYHHRPGRRILCSGGVENDGTNEAEALAAILETASVPRTSIDLDRNGTRTIDTIDFVAKHHSGEPIVLVTQPFHMPRVLFLARARGLDAWGLIAAGPTPSLRIRMREALGQFRALLDLTLT